MIGLDLNFMNIPSLLKILGKLLQTFDGETIMLYFRIR